MRDVLTLGVDVGSTASKCVILRDGAEVIGRSLIPAGTGTSGPQRALDDVLRQAGIAQTAIAYSIATGYGRASVAYANMRISELSCHALGAHILQADTRTVIDIGGQDAKVLHIDDEGALQSFVMNDKCAAGTGRFLDVMARVLELDVSELAERDAQSEKQISISSTCTVFAESEVISQLAAGADKRDIIRGIHRSVAHRVSGLVRRIGMTPAVMLTGGVAKNSGVCRALEEELGCAIAVYELAQHCGALGAAVMAYKRYLREQK